MDHEVIAPLHTVSHLIGHATIVFIPNTLFFFPSKHYFGLKKSNGENFDLRVTHRTEESLAIASVRIDDWTHEFEADLGDLATQSMPFMLKPLGVVAELGMNLDLH